ncbi:MAG TPA: phosphomannomutase/phosphoglucomutase [Candidatus Paceibacterota bacterium]|nr:phosphomannomutase/phosphoglucomutase [Candidatus Paceibacterota bacterium]
MVNEAIFKAYDIRGIYPDELNDDVIYKIAQAYARLVRPKRVVLGRDVRISGPSLWKAAAQGLTDHGVDVIDIGVITTDMMYFATAEYPDVDGGITISASHNPREYNGLKLMRKGAVSISGDTGIKDIKNSVIEGYSYKAEKPGNIEQREIVDDYLKKCASVSDISAIKPLKVVANGMFGPIIKIVRELSLPITLVTLNEEPDGNFPKGAPDPLLKENQTETLELVRTSKADLGVAWDGDADRFFLFDENGRWISGYYLTAFLGADFARKIPGAKIIHDPRLTWATEEMVKAAGGIPLENKVGHSFIKERMRKEDAVFAGEMSGHYYFKNFYYADNGLIPFLLVLEIVSKSGKKVSEIFEPYFSKYFISGEINTRLDADRNPADIFTDLEKKYGDAKIEHIDGLSVEYADWRANIRASNTEPLLRLNVEGKSQGIVDEKTKEILSLFGAR